MKPLVSLLLIAAVQLGCAKTTAQGRAPGEPEGDALVVTYYYLNF